MPDQRDQGFSLIAILAVVMLLGILATIAVSVNLSTSPAGPPTTASPGPGVGTTTATNVGSVSRQATLSACEASYASVDAALEAYRTMNGRSPARGTAWATSAADGGPFLQSWPSDPRYAITWDGSLLSVVPSRGATSHGSFGASSPPSGCYALT
jgi:type II secretory pathway pseudopilin PulG